MTQTLPVTILILDDDLGFAVWLGRILSEAGMQAVPACTPEEASAILTGAGLSHLDLVIVNRKVSGSREMLQQLSRQSPHPKVMGIEDAGQTTARGIHAVDATLERPRNRTIPSGDRYLQSVRRVLGLSAS